MSESKLQTYIKLFESLEPNEVYDMVLDHGSQLAASPEYTVDRTRDNFVYGCQSQVWVQGENKPTGWEFRVDSDSYLVKGIGAIVAECMSGLTTEELADVGFYDFKDLVVFFSQQRKQGLQAIINKCKQISRGN